MVFFNTKTPPVAPVKLDSYPFSTRFGRQSTTQQPLFQQVPSVLLGPAGHAPITNSANTAFFFRS
jgi:hypothetical protein